MVPKYTSYDKAFADVCHDSVPLIGKFIELSGGDTSEKVPGAEIIVVKFQGEPVAIAVSTLFRDTTFQ